MSLFDDLKRDFWGLLAVMLLAGIASGILAGALTIIMRAIAPEVPTCRIVVHQATAAVVSDGNCALEVIYKP